MTEQDTFERLKGLTAKEMLGKLKAHHAESKTVLHLYGYLTAMNTDYIVIKERNELLRKYNWKHEDFAKEILYTNLYTQGTI
jgi:hypothetical protein